MNSTNCSNTNKTQRRQRGLTLIELVVVLAILVALAGLIIGNFPSLFRKATRAVGANSIQDIARAVQFQATVKNNFGNGYDNLLKNDGTALYPRLAANGAGVAGGVISGLYTLTADDVTALAALGLDTVHNADDAVTDNITWDAYGPLASVGTTTLATGKKLAKVSAANVGTSLGGNALFNDSTTGYDYVILGVGGRCTLIGADKSLLEAPARSSALPGNDAKSTYQRYGVVFGLSGAGASRKATFLGAVGLESTGLTRTDSEVKDYSSN